MIKALTITFTGCSSLLFAAYLNAADSTIENSFNNFWNASTTTQAATSIDEIVSSGASFAEVYSLLKAGRQYPQQNSGIVMQNHTGADGEQYYYALSIPESYNPAQQYQVRFDLHGGVGRSTTSEPRGNGQVRLASDAEQIHITPYAWGAAPWWGEAQVQNLREILDLVKRDYNVDENRVVLSGVSDGGTGSYYIAMRETTRFASILPLNSFIMVLANQRIDDGHSFMGNLRNKPLFVITGENDRLYPTASVAPYVEYLASNGVETAYYPQDGGEHNTRWWPEMKDVFESFVTDHPREPHPQVVTWEVSDDAALLNNRAHWLIIEAVVDANSVSSALMTDLNIPTSAIGSYSRANRPVFERSGKIGRVDVERNGNTIIATTSGVGSFTLLLSPDVFDFSQPVVVRVNGETVFSDEVSLDLKTLLKWAALDNDRAMLYGVELKIELGVEL